MASPDDKKILPTQEEQEHKADVLYEAIRDHSKTAAVAYLSYALTEAYKDGVLAGIDAIESRFQNSVSDVVVVQEKPVGPVMVK